MSVTDEENTLPAGNSRWTVSRLTARKLKSICYYVLAWLVFTSVFFLLRFLGRDDFNMHLALALSIQFSLLAGLFQGVHEVVILQDQRHSYALWLSVLRRSLVQILAYSICFLLVAHSWAAFYPTSGTLSVTELLRNHDVQAFFIYALVTGTLVTFVRSVHKKFGSRVLVNTLLGKSQAPTEEERIFMLLDLRSATRLAEELGNVAYSSFLRDYFRLVSNCCAENQGEVYQFAGDGVYLTWPMDRCRRIPHPVLCFHDLVICFRRTRKTFEREYGAFPEFKAAIHSGRVIATEVGNYGSEMAYHGDPINTTARLQSLCNLLKRDLLITETLLRKLPHTAGFKVEEHGGFQLKGKLHELEVYSIDVDQRDPIGPARQ